MVFAACFAVVWHPVFKKHRNSNQPWIQKILQKNRRPACSKTDSKNLPRKISFPPGSLLTENPPPEIFMQFFTPVEAG